MAVHRPGHPGAVRRFDDGLDEGAEFLGNGVSHRVGDVEGGGPAVGGSAEDLGEKCRVGSACVLRGELDVLDEAARVRHGLSHLGEYLFRGHLELELHVDGACGDERVDSRFLRPLDRLGGCEDIFPSCPGKSGDNRAVHLLRDELDRLEVAGGSGRKTCLDDVHVHLRELEGYPKLLFFVQVDPGGLFPVPEGGVEYTYPVALRHVLLSFHPSPLPGIKKEPEPP